MIIREATHADIPAIARLHVDSWRTTYKGILPDEFLADLNYEMRERQWQRTLSEEGLEIQRRCLLQGKGASVETGCLQAVQACLPKSGDQGRDTV